MRNFSVATFIAVLRSLLSLPVQEQQHAVDRQVTQQVHGVFGAGASLTSRKPMWLIGLLGSLPRRALGR